MAWGGYEWRPYVSAAERRAKGAREVARLNAAGKTTAPVLIEGRKIAHTFWGQAWCENLESYRDYENRLPRGRTYVRNGSVLDLQIMGGKVTALVSGSRLYRVTVTIRALEPSAWKALARECSGKIDSVIELLAGRLSRGVMELVSRKGGGLFPAPGEITLACSCPDYAGMCKHIAAALYGVGARLDERPELLFTLRQVDAADLVDAKVSLVKTGGSKERVLSGRDLSSVFGIELDAPAPVAAKKEKKKQTKAPRKPRASTTLSAAELIARGVPRPTIQGWVRQGVLVATDARGVYRATPEAHARLASYSTRG